MGKPQLFAKLSVLCPVIPIPQPLNLSRNEYQAKQSAAGSCEFEGIFRLSIITSKSFTIEYKGLVNSLNTPCGICEAIDISELQQTDFKHPPNLLFQIAQPVAILKTPPNHSYE